MKIYPRSIDIKNGNDPGSFTITNSSRENKLLLFKVRRSDPKVVSFKPHFGVVQAGCKRSVALWLTDTHAARAHVLVKFVALRSSKSVGAFDKDWQTGSKKGVVKKTVQLRNLSQLSEDECRASESAASPHLDHEHEHGDDDDGSANISLISASTQESAPLSVASTVVSVSVASASASMSVASRIGSHFSGGGGGGGGGFSNQHRNHQHLYDEDADSAFSSCSTQQLPPGGSLQDENECFNLIVSNRHRKPGSRQGSSTLSHPPRQNLEEQSVDNVSQEVDSSYKKALADVDSLFSSPNPKAKPLSSRPEEDESEFSSSPPQQMEATSGLNLDVGDEFDIVVENDFCRQQHEKHHVEPDSQHAQHQRHSDRIDSIGHHHGDEDSVISDISQYEHDFVAAPHQQTASAFTVNTSGAHDENEWSHDYERESINFVSSVESSPASLASLAIKSTLRTTVIERVEKNVGIQNSELQSEQEVNHVSESGSASCVSDVEHHEVLEGVKLGSDSASTILSASTMNSKSLSQSDSGRFHRESDGLQSPLRSSLEPHIGGSTSTVHGVHATNLRNLNDSSVSMGTSSAVNNSFSSTTFHSRPILSPGRSQPQSEGLQSPLCLNTDSHKDHSSTVHGVSTSHVSRLNVSSGVSTSSNTLTTSNIFQSKSFINRSNTSPERIQPEGLQSPLQSSYDSRKEDSHVVHGVSNIHNRRLADSSMSKNNYSMLTSSINSTSAISKSNTLPEGILQQSEGLHSPLRSSSDGVRAPHGNRFHDSILSSTLNSSTYIGRSNESPSKVKYDLVSSQLSSPDATRDSSHAGKASPGKSPLLNMGRGKKGRHGEGKNDEGRTTENERSDGSSADKSTANYVVGKKARKKVKRKENDDDDDNIFSGQDRDRMSRLFIESETLSSIDQSCRLSSSVQVLLGTDGTQHEKGNSDLSHRILVFGAAADETVAGRALALRLCALFCAGKSVTAMSIGDCPMEFFSQVLFGLCPSRCGDSHDHTNVDVEVESDTKELIEERFPQMVEKMLHIDESARHRNAPIDFWGWDIATFYQMYFFDKIDRISITKTNMTYFIGKNGFNSFEYLESLDLSNNKIDRIDKALDLPLLKFLNLSGNLLKSLDYLQPLINLHTLDVSKNKLKSLHTSLHMLVSLSGSLTCLNMASNAVCDDLRYHEEAALLFPLLHMFDGVDIQHLDSYQVFEEPPAQSEVDRRPQRMQLESSTFRSGDPEVSFSPPPSLGTKVSPDRAQLRYPIQSQPIEFAKSGHMKSHVPISFSNEDEIKTARLIRLFQRARKTHGQAPFSASLDGSGLLKTNLSPAQQFSTSMDSRIIAHGRDSAMYRKLSASLDIPHAKQNVDDDLQLSSSLHSAPVSSAWAVAPLKYSRPSRSRDPSPPRKRGVSPSRKEEKSYMRYTQTAKQRLTSPSREQQFKHRSLLQQAKSLEARRKFEKRNEDRIAQKRGEINYYELRRSKNTLDSHPSVNDLPVDHSLSRGSFSQTSITSEENIRHRHSYDTEQNDGLNIDQSDGGPNYIPEAPSTLRMQGTDGWSLTFSDDQNFLSQVKNQISHSIQAAMTSTLGDERQLEHNDSTSASNSANITKADSLLVDDQPQDLDREGCNIMHNGLEDINGGLDAMQNSLHLSLLKKHPVTTDVISPQRPKSENIEDKNAEKLASQSLRFSWDTSNIVEKEWVTVSAADNEIRVVRSHHHPDAEDRNDGGGLLEFKSTLAAQLTAMETVVGELHSKLEVDENISDFVDRDRQADCGVQVEVDEISNIRSMAVSSAWQFSEDSNNQNCEDCDREMDYKKQEFIKNLDLNSFVNLKEEMHTSKRLNGKHFPDVIISPKRKLERNADHKSQVEEAYIVELMNLLTHETSPTHNSVHDISGSVEGSMDVLLARLLREELEDHNDVTSEGLSKNTTPTSAPKRQSKIPKYFAKASRALSQSQNAQSSSIDVGVNSVGEDDEARGRNCMNSQDCDHEKKADRPRKRSVSPSVLNLLLPVERHQCRYCSPPKKSTDASRSDSPPWNYSTKPDSKLVKQEDGPNKHNLEKNIKSSQPSDFFSSPQKHKKPFKAGILKTASPAKIPHRLSPTPTKIPTSTRQRSQDNKSKVGSRGSSEKKAKGRIIRPANNDVMDLLGSYHDSDGIFRGSKSSNLNSVSQSESSFRLREDFSVELGRGPSPPTPGTPVMLSPSTQQSQPSTVVFSPSRRTPLTPKSGIVSLKDQCDDGSDHHIGDDSALVQQFSPQRPSFEADAEANSSMLSNKLDTNSLSSQLRASAYSSSSLPRAIPPHMDSLEEEERFYMDVDPDSLHSVIKQFSIQKEGMKQTGGVFTSPHHDALSQSPLRKTYSSELESESKLSKKVEDSAKMVAGDDTQAENGGVGTRDGESDSEMDRYMTWLSNQSGHSEERHEENDDTDIMGTPTVHTIAESSLQLQSKSPLHTQFESNLSAWRDSHADEGTVDDTNENQRHSGIRENDEDDAYSDDFDPEWKEDAKIIASKLGLNSHSNSSPSSESSPFAGLKSPLDTTSAVQDVQSTSDTESKAHHDSQPSRQSEYQSRPPINAGPAMSTPDPKVLVTTTPSYLSSQAKHTKLAPPYGTPQSLSKGYSLSLSGLDDDYTDCSGSTHSPLPLANVRHPRRSALTPSQDDPSDHTPPSALFSTSKR